MSMGFNVQCMTSAPSTAAHQLCDLGQEGTSLGLTSLISEVRVEAQLLGCSSQGDISAQEGVLDVPGT